VNSGYEVQLKELSDHHTGFDYSYKLELVYKMTIRGNELCFEQEEK
jgi:hypothetical protein